VSVPPRVAFVLEQSLGHVTHSDNLVRLLTPEERIEAVFAPIDFDLGRRWARPPGFGYWTVRAGLRARRAVRDLSREGRLDALFVHTQVAATLMPDVLSRIPSVVSLDATPIQYDELGFYYGHSTNGARVEQAKWRLNRSCFARAERLVSWSEWAKQGLVNRYDVPPEKVVVIPPGVDCDRWAERERAPAQDETGGPVRILFVGADFVRKGGPSLLGAVRRLRNAGADVELDVVTREPLATEAGVTLHHGVGPNSPDLIDLYWSADIFCLPTFADSMALVLAEAGIAGLPLVSTNVGGISELVLPEQTGLLVQPGDEVALTAALERLVADPELRRSWGGNAQRLVREKFNAAVNASRLVDLLLGVVRPL
jgi:glycosyltransferase involved in cell wall biosynthesis